VAPKEQKPMFKEYVYLKDYSNYKIGGPARFFTEVKNSEETKEAILYARSKNLPIFILGGGTNILFDDKGYDGVVIKPSFNQITRSGNFVTVGAGVLVSELLSYLVSEELAGLEWAGGLPGTIGGAVWGNAGAFGGEIKDNVVRVLSISMDDNPRVIERDNPECEFEYRMSVFKNRSLKGFPEIISEIVFEFSSGVKEDLLKVINEKKQYRVNKQPIDLPNAGSMFKNIPARNLSVSLLEKYKEKIKNDPFPVLPVAVLIDSAGLKGVKRGGAMISDKHPNFIVSFDNASSEDVKYLVLHVKQELKKQFSVEVEQEVLFI